jgi:geranylgeranyl pyrophosphate synthase
MADAFVPRELNKEITRLKSEISAWIDHTDPEMRSPLRWQLFSQSKYFRPLTLFACRLAVEGKRVNEAILRSAVALELFHNVSLIVDDILDRSRMRRGRKTLHCRYGSLPALMVSGYLTAAGFRMVASDSYSVAALGELLQRLGVAECLQWRLRRRPLGIADWRAIASEDTGSMFEICARLGTRDLRLQKFGSLLGILYHGCDDVSDVRGTAALGGGGEEDVRDGILTLPAAIAIRDPKVALRFENARNGDRAKITKHLVAALPEAEEYLDQVATEASDEALRRARNPEPLLAMVHLTRSLSVR